MTIHTQKTPKFIRRFARELLSGLSKIGVRKANINYFGKKVQVPMIYGMGRFHFNPDFHPWLKKNFKLIDRLNSDYAVLDIGVNVGQFMLNLKSYNDQISYYGFEPNPPCIFYNYELIRLNQFPNTYLFPLAMGPKDQISFLHSYAYDSGTSSLVGNKTKDSGGFSTTVFAYDSSKIINMLKKKIAFIKIDVEGFEFEVLKGLKQALSDHQPFIYCEILENAEKTRVKNIFEYLTSINYQVIGTTRAEYKPFVINSAEDFEKSEIRDYMLVPSSKLAEYLGLLG
jgi:FkbM family methyltransferase